MTIRCLPLIFLAGCVLQPRVLALEELQPAALQKLSNIEGRTYFIDIGLDPRGTKNVGYMMGQGVTWVDYANWQPAYPGMRHDYLGLSSARQWEVPPHEWTEIGHLRNGLGMEMAGVYSTNPPERWLTDALAMEIAAQGGVLVADPASADVVIGGSVTYLKADMYFKTKVDLIVSWRFTAGTRVVDQTWHTYGDHMAWTGSRWEFYSAAHDAEAQQMWLVLDQLNKLG